MRISDWSSDVCSSYFAPSDAAPGSATDIRVNIRYVMTVDIQYTAYNKYEQPMGSAGTESTTVSFDTARPSDGSGDSLACTSTGVLEERILAAAKTGRASCRERVCQYV